MNEPAPLLDSAALVRALTRIAHEIAERNADDASVLLLGIPRGGSHLARRLGKLLEGIWGHPVPVGTLDISMHRDDLSHRTLTEVFPTEIPGDINGRVVVLVDDVLYSGRTVRAALDAVHDFGRPRRVQLAVLVDRGHRDLPVRADYVGKNVPTSHKEWVHVRLAEEGGDDSVTLEKRA